MGNLVALPEANLVRCCYGSPLPPPRLVPARAPPPPAMRRSNSLLSPSSKFGIIAACLCPSHFPRHPNAIGSDNTIPWVLRSDRQYFKDTTKDATIIMGRGTWAENNKHLPHASNTIVLTRNKDKRGEYNAIPNVSSAASLSAALALAQPPVWVVGGEAVYREALSHDLAESLHLTVISRVKLLCDLDSANRVAKFPATETWDEAWERAERVVEETDEYAFRIDVFNRRRV